uniref:Trithorax group protein osa n=1 Tax=Panagrellus redivivus TaxID=6233 RepID=A0A7E4VDV8_PANRE
MVRSKDPRQLAGARYQPTTPKEQPYGASVITVNVDKPVGAAIRRGYQREEVQAVRRHQPSLAPSHSPSSNDEDDFNNYDYEMVDGRDHQAYPRLDFGNGHQRPFPNHQNGNHHPLPSAQRSPKYENCYKQPTSAMDSDFDDEVTLEESRTSHLPAHAKQNQQIQPNTRLNAVKNANNGHPSPPAKTGSKIGAVGGSFRTALSNHPLVKQQQRLQQQQNSVQSTPIPPPPPPPPPQGMNICVSKDSNRQMAGNQYDGNGGYGRNAFVNSRREVFEESNERYGRGCEQEPSESLDLPTPKSSNGSKTIQIFADKSPAPAPEAARAWEPLKHTPTGHRNGDSGNVNKVRSVVNKLNKDPIPKGGKDSMRSVINVGKQQLASGNDNVIFKSASTPPMKPLPPATLEIPPPPPLPPVMGLNNGSYSKQKTSKPSLTSLATDDVSFTDSLPPPPKQLQKASDGPKAPNSDDPLSDEADLLLSFFKSNWQLVDYLQIKMPRGIIDRMNRLPRKVVFLKDASDLAKLRKTLRRPPAKRIRGARRTTNTRFNLHRRVLDRVSSMREEDLKDMVSQQSTLQRRAPSPSERERRERQHEPEIVDDDVTYAPHAQIRGHQQLQQQLSQQSQLQQLHQHQDERVYQRTGRQESFGRRTPPPLMDSISESMHQPYSQRDANDEKWSAAYQNSKKNHRFVKKSAAGIITKRQSTSPTPLYASGKQPAPPPPGKQHQVQQEQPSQRTESRIAAEIANLREREDELRRDRAAMGLPVSVDDIVSGGGGHWKHDPRMIPLRETRSFNHLKINVENENQASRNWPPLQNGGHYGMTKSESFHQLHHQYMAGPPSHAPNNAPNSGNNPQKYLRRANGPPSGSLNGYDAAHSSSCWIPADSKPYRWRSVAATLVSRRARSTTPRPMSVPPASTIALSSPVFINTAIGPNKGSSGIYGVTGSDRRPRSSNATGSSPYATLRMFAKYPLRAKLFSWPKRLRATPILNGRSSAMGL